MFDHVALFQFVGDDGDKVLEVMLNADVDVDDVEVEEGQVSLYAKASEFFKAKTALQEGFPGLELETAEVTWLPQSSKQISGEDAQTFKKFLDLLNECDDVQEVYHNAVLAE
jgi:transcriptional/translational regulatory protein YebC/TACO1